MMKSLLLLIPPVLMLLLPGDEFSRGVRAYQEGRFKEALEAFSEDEKAAGNSASAELLHNKAMAALRAGELLVAEYSAEKVVVRGGPGFAAWRDFLMGSTAYARSEKAEAKANKPDAEPSAFEEAIAHAEIARNYWQLAAARRSDWPEARRNVERALLKLKELKGRKEAAEQQKIKKKEKKKIEIQIDPRLQSDPTNRQQVSRIDPLLDELSPELVKRLYDKLEEKKREKISLRRTRQRMQSAEVEKDW